MKPRICPKCNKEITYLRNIITGTLVYYIALDKQGDLQYEENEFNPDGVVAEYLCPECEEILFTEEAEALAFLERKE